jgi:hypothetical protein
MATYSSSVTLKVNGAVDYYHSGGSVVGQVTVYTAPATGYAVVNLYTTAATGTTSWYINGNIIAATTAMLPDQIYLGPSQVLQYSASGSHVVHATGVSFVNSP